MVPRWNKSPKIVFGCVFWQKVWSQEKAVSNCFAGYISALTLGMFLKQFTGLEFYNNMFSCHRNPTDIVLRQWVALIKSFLTVSLCCFLSKKWPDTITYSRTNPPDTRFSFLSAAKPMAQGPPGGVIGILGGVVAIGLIIGVAVTVFMVHRRQQKTRTETDNDLWVPSLHRGMLQRAGQVARLGVHACQSTGENHFDKNGTLFVSGDRKECFRHDSCLILIHAGSEQFPLHPSLKHAIIAPRAE